MKQSSRWSKTVRVLALVAAIALLVGVFAGCGEKKNAKDDQGRTVISVGGWPTKEGTAMDNMNARKEAFEKTNSDVAVNGDTWSFSLDTFYAKAAGGELPIVYDTNFTELPQVVDSEYAADLTDALKKHNILDKFNPTILDLAKKNDKVYAFPVNAYVLGISGNMDLMSKAGLVEADGTPKQPKDWNEVVDFALKIKEATGKPGLVFPTTAKQGGWMFVPIAWSYGVEFMKKEDGKWISTFNTPECVEALQFIKDLKWKHNILPDDTLIDGNKYCEIFGGGNAGMWIVPGNWSDYVAKYGMKPEQFGMMAFPAGPKRHVTQLGGGLKIVSNQADEDQVDAAVRWIQTECNFEPTEDYKNTTMKTVDNQVSKGYLVGIKSMSVWNADTESVKFLYDYIDKNCNVNPNQVKLYNEFVQNPCELQGEEPVCAQELYDILDKCIQEVLTNKDADCAEVIKKASADFQSNYLNNVTY